MPTDPYARLAQARREHALAIAHRDALQPGGPGYAEAVQRVGTTWSQVQYWTRRAARERAG